MSSLPEQLIFSVKNAGVAERYVSFSGPHRQLRCGPDEGVFSDTTKFAVEPAADGLVHIRSCYENYYWFRPSRFERWLVASSPEKVEDMSKDGCTLFRPHTSADNAIVTFEHVQSGLNVVMLPPSDIQAFYLCVELAAPTEFTYVDYAPLARTRLPRYIMFLGDNNKYLGARPHNQFYDNLDFQEFTNPTDIAVGFETLYSKSGELFVNSMRFDAPWTIFLPGPQIRVSTTGGHTKFEVIISESSSGSPSHEVKVALLCHGNNRYCQRKISVANVLMADLRTPDPQTSWFTLKHAERRKVNIESFRHAQLITRSTSIPTSKKFVNGSITDMGFPVNLPYKEITKNAFSNSIAAFTGPPLVFSGRMPFVSSNNGQLEFQDHNTEVTTTWGTFDVTYKDDVYDKTFSVPPRTEATVSLVMNVVAYEVPFSYQQVENFHFGNKTHDLHDGVFNIYREYFAEAKIQYQPLNQAEESDAQGNTRQDASAQGADAEDDIKPTTSDQVSE